MTGEREPHDLAEPVAWRVKDFADGWILFHSEAEALREAEGAGNLVQPLYTRAEGDGAPSATLIRRSAMKDEIVEAMARAAEGWLEMGGERQLAGDILKALDQAGYAVVPKEATDQMARGAQATGMGLVTPEARKEMFRAMVAASQPNTSQEAGR